MKSQIFFVWNLLSSLNPSFPIANHQPTHHPSNIPQSRLQSKSEDPAEEEHWLLSVQDSWKTSSTSLLVLSLLFILLLLLLGMAAVKIAKHLFRQFCHILSTFVQNTFCRRWKKGLNVCVGVVKEDVEVFSINRQENCIEESMAHV